MEPSFPLTVSQAPFLSTLSSFFPHCPLSPAQFSSLRKKGILFICHCGAGGDYGASGEGVGWAFPSSLPLWFLLSCQVSLRLHGLQHARLPCPSLPPGVLSRWCQPTISSSVTPFSFCPHSFPPSESFLMSWLSDQVARVQDFSFSISPSGEYSRLISCIGVFLPDLLHSL